MAQNVTIQGASYSDVPAVELPKPGGGVATFTDVSDSTADVADVANGEVFYNAGGTRSIGTGKYASAPIANGNANRTNAILYGEVDSTSTSTVFTATVSGLTEYADGTAVLLKNGVVTSASGFTININGLGAKPCYSNMATGNDITPTAPTRDTTIFNMNYTMLIVYSSTIVSGGGWIMYRGYDANTNTIGYQLRTNATVLPVSDRTRYYRMLFTSANGKKWVPANTGYDNSATSKKTVNTTKIDPFGRIVYLANNTNYNADADVGAGSIWDQYTFSLGFSFNTTGSALTMTTKTPVYVKCTPQSDGSAIIDSTTPYVQVLPVTEDGYIYIFLGIAYSATNIELVPGHPVYYYKDGQIRLWTNAASGGGGGLLVNINDDGVGNYACDKTAQQIKDALDSGTQIVFKHIISLTQTEYLTMKQFMIYSATDIRLFFVASFSNAFTCNSFSNYPSYSSGNGGGNN